ncbi:PAS domain-containing protein [Phanerochaete sordida]|uniref:PAS domain-containing protein n=1 Tax=Phanerochaete sordida TaxID=48140 RepID=A0A9P3G2V9_9APHY|nr:PAS domain-containing protein [Phanerochaete sordida]
MEAPLVTTLPPPTLPANQTANPQLIFDFTKRKRWADLLVTELTEVITLVLSEDGTVLYCGPAVKALLGWTDEELVDMNFCDIMNDEDISVFQRQFADSIRAGTDLLAYARLRCKSGRSVYVPNIPVIPAVPSLAAADGSILQSPSEKAPEVFFEIKGYPHFMTDSTTSVHDTFDTPKGRSTTGAEDHTRASSSSAGPSSSNGGFGCFFAMAKPYPSRNTAMLNTFLELKMENERLQQRLRDAKAKDEALSRTQAQRQVWTPHTFPQQTPYAGQPETLNGAPAFQSFAWTQTSSVPGPSRSFDSRQFYDPGRLGGSSTPGSSSSSGAERGDAPDSSGDPSLPRKKSKKPLTQERYCCMTCGRTDSPEWRKGPQGPKTLCNACGLRWAKTAKTSRTNAAAAGEGETSTEPLP